MKERKRVIIFVSSAIFVLSLIFLSFYSSIVIAGFLVFIVNKSIAHINLQENRNSSGSRTTLSLGQNFPSNPATKITTQRRPINRIDNQSNQQLLSSGKKSTKQSHFETDKLSLSEYSNNGFRPGALAVQTAAGPLLTQNRVNATSRSNFGKNNYYDEEETEQNNSSSLNSSGYLLGPDRTILSAYRRYPTHQPNYAFLGSFPSVHLGKHSQPFLNLSQSVAQATPVTVRIAPPRVLTPNQRINLTQQLSPQKSSLANVQETVTVNPCDPKTVVAALKENKKRSLKEREDLSDKESKKRRHDSTSSSSSAASKNPKDFRDGDEGRGKGAGTSSSMDSVNIRLPKKRMITNKDDDDDLIAEVPDDMPKRSGQTKRPATPFSPNYSPSNTQMVKRHRNDAISCSYSSTNKKTNKQDVYFELPPRKRQADSSHLNLPDKKMLKKTIDLEENEFVTGFKNSNKTKNINSTLINSALEEEGEDMLDAQNELWDNYKESNFLSTNLTPLTSSSPPLPMTSLFSPPSTIVSSPSTIVINEGESHKRSLSLYTDIGKTNKTDYNFPEYVPTLAEHKQDQLNDQKRLAKLLGLKNNHEARNIGEAVYNFQTEPISSPQNSLLIPKLSFPLANTNNSTATATTTSGIMASNFFSTAIAASSANPTASTISSIGSPSFQFFSEEEKLQNKSNFNFDSSPANAATTISLTKENTGDVVTNPSSSNNKEDLSSSIFNPPNATVPANALEKLPAYSEALPSYSEALPSYSFNPATSSAAPLVSNTALNAATSSDNTLFSTVVSDTPNFLNSSATNKWLNPELAPKTGVATPQFHFSTDPAVSGTTNNMPSISTTPVVENESAINSTPTSLTTTPFSTHLNPIFGDPMVNNPFLKAKTSITPLSSASTITNSPATISIMNPVTTATSIFGLATAGSMAGGFNNTSSVFSSNTVGATAVTSTTNAFNYSNPTVATTNSNSTLAPLSTTSSSLTNHNANAFAPIVQQQSVLGGSNVFAPSNNNAAAAFNNPFAPKSNALPQQTSHLFNSSSAITTTAASLPNNAFTQSNATNNNLFNAAAQGGLGGGQSMFNTMKTSTSSVITPTSGLVTNAMTSASSFFSAPVASASINSNMFSKQLMNNSVTNNSPIFGSSSSASVTRFGGISSSSGTGHSTLTATVAVSSGSLPAPSFATPSFSFQTPATTTNFNSPQQTAIQSNNNSSVFGAAQLNSNPSATGTGVFAFGQNNSSNAGNLNSGSNNNGGLITSQQSGNQQLGFRNIYSGFDTAGNTSGANTNQANNNNLQQQATMFGGGSQSINTANNQQSAGFGGFNVENKNFNFGSSNQEMPKFGTQIPAQTVQPYVFSAGVPNATSTPMTSLFSIGAGNKDRRTASTRRRLPRK